MKIEDQQAGRVQNPDHQVVMVRNRECAEGLCRGGRARRGPAEIAVPRWRRSVRGRPEVRGLTVAGRVDQDLRARGVDPIPVAVTVARRAAAVLHDRVDMLRGDLKPEQVRREGELVARFVPTGVVARAGGPIVLAQQQMEACSVGIHTSVLSSASCGAGNLH